jgi:hypothetical protein
MVGSMNGGKAQTFPGPTTYVTFSFYIILNYLFDFCFELYALNPPVVRIAAFRRCSEETPVGRSTGLLQYTFAQDGLVLYSLVTLCLNRWVDMYAM